MKLSFNLLLVVCLSFQTFFASAQNVIEKSTTDKEFANTTIVQKQKGSSDIDVLNEIDRANASAGLGEVVRIVEARPEPVAQVQEAPVYFTSTINAEVDVRRNVQSFTTRVAPTTAVKKTVRKRTPTKRVKKAAPKVAVKRTSKNRSTGGTSYSVSKEAAKNAYWKKAKRRKTKYKKKRRKLRNKRKVRCPKF